MNVLQCPECGALDIPGQANSCPECGFPIVALSGFSIRERLRDAAPEEPPRPPKQSEIVGRQIKERLGRAKSAFRKKDKRKTKSGANPVSANSQPEAASQLVPEVRHVEQAVAVMEPVSADFQEKAPLETPAELKSPDVITELSQPVIESSRTQEDSANYEKPSFSLQPSTELEASDVDTQSSEPVTELSERQNIKVAPVETLESQGPPIEVVEAPTPELPARPELILEMEPARTEIPIVDESQVVEASAQEPDLRQLHLPAEPEPSAHNAIPSEISEGMLPPLEPEFIEEAPPQIAPKREEKQRMDQTVAIPDIREGNFVDQGPEVSEELPQRIAPANEEGQPDLQTATVSDADEETIVTHEPEVGTELPTPIGVAAEAENLDLQNAADSDAEEEAIIAHEPEVGTELSPRIVLAEDEELPEPMSSVVQPAAAPFRNAPLFGSLGSRGSEVSLHPTDRENLDDASQCFECGKEVDPDANFCPFCKASLLRRLCPGCRRLVAGNTAFCAYCGTAASSLAEPPRNFTTLIAVLLIAFTAFAIFLAKDFLFEDPDSIRRVAENEVTEPTPPVAAPKTEIVPTPQQQRKTPEPVSGRDTSTGKLPGNQGLIETNIGEDGQVQEEQQKTIPPNQQSVATPSTQEPKAQQKTTPTAEASKSQPNTGVGFNTKPITGVPRYEHRDPGLARYLNSVGFRLIRQKRYDEAVPILRRSVSYFPDNTRDIIYAYALFNLGHALRMAGQPREAIPILEARMKIDNQRETVRKELAAARVAALKTP